MTTIDQVERQKVHDRLYQAKLNYRRAVRRGSRVTVTERLWRIVRDIESYASELDEEQVR